VDGLVKVPMISYCLSIHALPPLTITSKLEARDEKGRGLVLARF
jgi:hypothetical protein